MGELSPCSGVVVQSKTHRGFRPLSTPQDHPTPSRSNYSPFLKLHQLSFSAALTILEILLIGDPSLFLSNATTLISLWNKIHYVEIIVRSFGVTEACWLEKGTHERGIANLIQRSYRFYLFIFFSPKLKLAGWHRLFRAQPHSCWTK